MLRSLPPEVRRGGGRFWCGGGPCELRQMGAPGREKGKKGQETFPAEGAATRQWPILPRRGYFSLEVLKGITLINDKSC